MPRAWSSDASDTLLPYRLKTILKQANFTTGQRGSWDMLLQAARSRMGAVLRNCQLHHQVTTVRTPTNMKLE